MTTGELLRQLDECTARAAELLRHGSVCQQAPARGGWSALECIDHLTRTTAQMLPGLTEAVRQAPPLAPDERPRAGWLIRLAAWMMEPPYRVKARTREGFHPRAALAPGQVQRDFEASQQELRALLEQGRGRALHRRVMVSPFNRKFRYDAWGAFAFLLAHQRRHLWQAGQALTRAGVDRP